MNVDIDIEHTDLDTPDPDDGDDAVTYITISIMTADGMRYSANVSRDGNPEVAEVADMIAKAVKAVATAHSIDLPRHLGCVRYNPPLPPR